MAALLWPQLSPAVVIETAQLQSLNSYLALYRKRLLTPDLDNMTKSKFISPVNFCLGTNRVRSLNTEDLSASLSFPIEPGSRIESGVEQIQKIKHVLHTVLWTDECLGVAWKTAQNRWGSVALAWNPSEFQRLRLPRLSFWPLSLCIFISWSDVELELNRSCVLEFHVAGSAGNSRAGFLACQIHVSLSYANF